MTFVLAVVLAAVVLWLTWLDRYAGKLADRVDTLELEDDIRRLRERHDG